MSRAEEGFVQSLEEALRLANTVLFQRGRSVLAGMEVSSPQFNALLALYEFGPLTMSQLCKHLFTACSTATDLADRMEKTGLAIRDRDKKDRRVVRMQLLPKGEDVVRAVISERQRFLNNVLQVYSEQEFSNLMSVLDLFAQRIEQVHRSPEKAEE